MWKYILLCIPVTAYLTVLEINENNQEHNEKLKAQLDSMNMMTIDGGKLWILNELDRHQNEHEDFWESPSEPDIFSGRGNLAEISQGASVNHTVVDSRQQPIEIESFTAPEDLLKSHEELKAVIPQGILWETATKQTSFAQEFGNAGSKRRQRRYIGDGHLGMDFRKLPNSTVTLVHCEQLMVLKEEDSNGKLYGCTLSKRLFTTKEQRDQITKWRILADLVIVEQSVDAFMDLVDACLRTEKSNVSKTWTFKTLLSGIAPGTLWCGSNQLVSDLNQLGMEWTVDQCCRAHDLCPLQLPSLRVYRGLITFGPLMMSHCACDYRFDRCLHRARTLGARGIFHVYFNILYRTRNCVSEELLEGSHKLHTKPVDWYTRFINFIKSVFEFWKEIKYTSRRKGLVKKFYVGGVN